MTKPKKSIKIITKKVLQRLAKMTTERFELSPPKRPGYYVKV
jgi:hypothetical protein